VTQPPTPHGSPEAAGGPTRGRPVDVGVLSPSTGGFFFGQVLAGIVAEAAAVGARVTLFQTLDAGQTSDLLPESDLTLPVGWAHVDAFVTIAWATGREYLERARAAGTPVVLASNVIPGVDAASVVADNAGGVAAAVAHLVGHGHTRIGFVGHVGQSDIAERYAAYREAMASHGLAPLELVATGDQVESGGRAAAEVVAATAPRWTAVVAGTDRVAVGLLDGLRCQGLDVPGDVAVVGFDDAEAAWYTDPPLTTVRQRFAELGAEAARLAVAEARGERVPHERHTVPADLVVRQSCGCAPTDVAPPPAITAEAEALLAALGGLVGQPGLAVGAVDAVRPLTLVDRERVDPTIAAALTRLLRDAPSPEAVGGFAQIVVRRLADALAALPPDAPGRATLQLLLARTTALMAREQAMRASERSNRLADALGGQFAVGMSLLGRALGDDPADLRWLDRLGIRAGCLGLWTDDTQTRLRVAGARDDAGTLDHLVGSRVPVAEFPPAEVLHLADAGRGDVAYVIPVRGASGDHGLLCLVAPVDLEFGTQRATYDHWAALLGAALREQRLLSELRHSEERYALASRAAADGLWEWDVATGEVYLSERARELLDLPPDGGVPGTALVDLHPDDREMVRESLAVALERPDVPAEVEARVVRHDGRVVWVLMRALGVPRRGGGHRGLVGSISDIDHRKQLEEQLRRAALYDAVTGLPNRRLFLDRLTQALEHPRRRAEARFAVLFLDLDGFKLINDSLGHLMGDELLQVVGERLRADLRSVDTAARFGGDEFAVLLTDPVPEDLLLVARRIQQRISAPVRLGDQEVSVTASIGIATSATPYSDPEDVLRDADIAMYRAKESERGSACIFDPRMHQRAMDRLRTRTALQGALDRREFVVHYQPIVALDDPTVDTFEALVRWDHPERGLLPPSEFLPFMVGNPAIVTLGRQVLETVCGQVAEWRRTHGRPVTVAVNLAHREFWSPDLLPTVLGALERHGLPPDALVLEITESVIMTDPDAARAIMDALHRHGLRLHIDDFGTGHSSLNVLRTFPVDALKIDGSFVRELAVVEQTTALVRTIVTMSRALGLEVVAECVETPEQAEQLRTMGCTVAQGWLFARALPPEEAGALLAAGLPRADRAPETPA